MSLHLGNLSSRVQRDDLKRTFSRFGKNRLDIRDGYGFVIYDFPGNAEKALRKLRGKYICGERISVTWSNKQPKSFQRFFKGSRINEPYNRRGLGRGGGSSRHDRGFQLSRQPDGVGGEPNADDLCDKEKEYPCDDAVNDGGEKFVSVEKDDCRDEVLPIESDTADGRWGEPVSGLDSKEVANDVGLDHYESYHGYDSGDEDGDRYRANSDVSSARGKSREESRKDRTVETTRMNAADSENEPKCYVCGLAGHMRCYCADGNDFREEKFTRRGSERDGDVRFRFRSKRARPGSRGTSNCTRTPSPSRLRKRDGHLVGSKKYPRLVKDKSSPSAKLSKYQRMKKQKKEDGKSVNGGKKSRRASLSPQGSGSTASSWLSPTSSETRSSSRSRSRSRSRSSSTGTHSASSSSRSTSMLSKLRSENSRLKSKSVSPEALPLSIGLNQPICSSQNKIDIVETGTSSENHLEKDNGSASKQALIDHSVNAENSKVKSTNGTVLKGNKFSLMKVDDKMNMNDDRQLQEDGSCELDEVDYGMDGPSTNPSERVQAAFDYSSESQEDRNDPRQSGQLEMGDVQFSHEKRNREEPFGTEIKNSTNISSQEMCMVLKHYGLAMPNEENLSVEDYFGSARMWPWELIYYRRLKKGAISVDNYARRIAQNEEFGIVDKYIRSSSGWGECERSSL